MLNHNIASTSKILFVEACNYLNAPLGGQLTGARMLMRAFGNQLALVGWTDDKRAPIGQWHKRVIDDIEYDFFAVDYLQKPQKKRPLVPARLRSYHKFRKFGNDILSCGKVNVLTREPTVIMALPFTAKHNVCFWFPGIESALSVSRYPLARYFSGTFDWLFLSCLGKHCSTILAAADKEAINQLRQRSGKTLQNHDIQFFPTRVDTSLFNPGEREIARQQLRLPEKRTVVVTTGRLNRAKGLTLMLGAFEMFHRFQPESLFIFVGEGEQRESLEKRIAEKGLSNNVMLTGQQSPDKLSLYLQAADLFVMGSEKEGWSTSLVEALATGLPIVTTSFSSASTIVRKGVNGFVVAREPGEFAEAMNKALALNTVDRYSRNEIEKYALANIKNDLLTSWALQDD